MYTGRGIIAPNTQFIPEMVDERGSLPVEWWIMSKTEAKNAIPVKDEGRLHVLDYNYVGINLTVEGGLLIRYYTYSREGGEKSEMWITLCVRIIIMYNIYI